MLIQISAVLLLENRCSFDYYKSGYYFRNRGRFIINSGNYYMSVHKNNYQQQCLTFFFKSAMSIPPTLSESTATILNPAIAALAGFVPCAVLGMIQTYNHINNNYLTVQRLVSTMRSNIPKKILQLKNAGFVKYV